METIQETRLTLIKRSISDLTKLRNRLERTPLFENEEPMRPKFREALTALLLEYYRMRDAA